MKKTIIALLALGGVALGAQEVKSFEFSSDSNPVDLRVDFDLSQDWTLKFNVIMTPQDGDNITLISLGDALSIDVSPTSMTVNQQTIPIDDPYSWLYGGYSQAPLYFTLTHKSGNLTVVYDNEEEMSDGSVYGTYPITVDLTGKSFSTVSTGVDEDILARTTQSYGGTVVQLWSLPKDGTFTGYTVDSGNPSSPAIPEPTTATLSLLALAGLAARRRRK